jgi:DNA-binding LacI/PurR family transcriptional regulator
MSKRATSHDVAKAAKVSRTTVSLVLNQVPGVRISEATRERVFEAAKQLNYHPDITGRKLVSGKAFTLGLVLRQSPEQVFTDAFLPKVILGVEQAAERFGFRVLLKPIGSDVLSGYAGLINEKHVDGIILSGPRQDDLDIVRIQQDGFPVILMGQLPGYDIPFVDIDAVNGARTAVNYLIELGHTDIGMITNAPLEYTSAQQRHEGYRQALTEAGIESQDSRLCQGNFTPASGSEAMKKLLSSSPRPSAVFVASDVVAMGAMQAVKRAGLSIPEDISVVGFDDVPLAEYYDPPLTTIRLPAYELGWVASQELTRLVQGDVLETNAILLETELVVRESSMIFSQSS